MFCKHFIKIFVGVPSFNGETSRMGGCEVRGAHSIFLIKNMKSATAFCLDRLCFSDSASCYLSLWNAVSFGLRFFQERHHSPHYLFHDSHQRRHIHDKRIYNSVTSDLFYSGKQLCHISCHRQSFHNANWLSFLNAHCFAWE